MTYRILITGSRTWTDSGAIYDALRSRTGPGRCVVVHGGASGADLMAGAAARALGMDVEICAADWARYPRAAGHLRNRAMVERGADICLAFILDESRGATGCAALAARAGIPVVRYERTSLGPLTVR